MATITLYKDKLNSVSSLINTMVSSVNNLDMQLGALKSTLQGVNSSTYNLDSAVENIRSSSQTEQEKADDLNKLSKEVDNFITVTVNRDQAAKEEINKAKEDFYTKYSYLKPECEKDFIEKVVIHEAEGGRTKDRTQQVDIYFNFIGNFVLPLSEDEVEALQSEEARRAEEIAERERKSSKKSTQKRNQKPEIRKHRASLQSVNSIR